MSANLNLLTSGQPFADYTFNDNAASAQANIEIQQGAGVISGMTLSAGTWPTVNVAAGWVQSPRTVMFSGGTFAMPSTAGTYYIMADWSATYDSMTGLSTYSFSFSAQYSPTPPTNQVCLGQVVQTSSAFTSINTEGLIVIPHVSGSQWIAGQNRMVVDDSAGTVTVQNLQGGIMQKYALQSGDDLLIAPNYQAVFFGGFSLQLGASIASSGGELKVIN